MMVDVLLATSYFLRYDAKQLQKMKPYPPLATLYGAASLRASGCSVALFDAMLSEESEFDEALARHRPRLVVIYEDSFNFLTKMCLTRMRDAALRMATAARQRGCSVLAAGPDVTDHPEIYLRQGVQAVLAGEADATLLETVRALLEGRSDELDSIQGLIRLDGQERLLRNPPRPIERQPDRFPMPAWDLVDHQRYREAWLEAHGYFSLNLVSTRGCPFHCNWCAKPIWGQRYAMRSPANVAEEMAHVKRLLAPDHIWFADDIFGLRPHWIAEFAREVLERRAKTPFTIQSRIDLMSPEAVQGLAQAGCVEVWLGVESGSQKILDAMDKGIDAKDVPLVRERLREAGIRACFFLQLGYPGESFEDILATVQLLRETLPDDVGISVSYPLPGTEFHQRVQEELGRQRNWLDSNDLAMMFQGTYQTAFYRRLHGLIHRDLELHTALSRGDAEAAERLASLELEWDELRGLEPGQRSPSPSRLPRRRPRSAPPDLSKGWN